MERHADKSKGEVFPENHEKAFAMRCFHCGATGHLKRNCKAQIKEEHEISSRVAEAEE